MLVLLRHDAGIAAARNISRSGTISLCKLELDGVDGVDTELDSYCKLSGRLCAECIAVQPDGSVTSIIGTACVPVRSQVLPTPFQSLQWQQLYRDGIDKPELVPIDYCTLNREQDDPTTNALLKQLEHALSSSCVQHAVFFNHYEQQATTLQAAAEYEAMGYCVQWRDEGRKGS